MGAIEILFYQTKAGREPVSQWLKSLDGPIRQRVIKRIERVKFGNLGEYKILTGADGLFELKMDFSGGLRLYVGRQDELVVLLLMGGDKKTQKGDIEKAKKYWQEHCLSRKGSV